MRSGNEWVDGMPDGTKMSKGNDRGCVGTSRAIVTSTQCGRKRTGMGRGGRIHHRNMFRDRRERLIRRETGRFAFTDG